MNTREAINKLRAQGLSDTQILETLFPDQEQEPTNQPEPGKDSQEDEEGDSSDSDSSDEGGEPGEGDSQDQDGSSEDQDDQAEGQGETSEDSDDQPEADEDDSEPAEPTNQDAGDSHEANQEYQQNQGWGGISLPEGYRPSVKPATKQSEARALLNRWIKQSLGGRQASSRRDAAKLCVRMVSRASLQHTHKLEQTKKRLLVCIDVSSSCWEVAPTYVQIAYDLAKVEKRLAVLVHSNGTPVELTVDGKTDKTRFLKMVRSEERRRILSNPNFVQELVADQGPSLLDLGRSAVDLEKMWRVLNGLNLQGVLALGDSDAETMLEYLANVANLCWIGRTISDKGTASEFRQARRLTEKGVVFRYGGDDLHGTLEAFKTLPHH